MEFGAACRYAILGIYFALILSVVLAYSADSASFLPVANEEPPPADFLLHPSAKEVVLQADGARGNLRINIEAVRGFHQPVTLRLAELPLGLHTYVSDGMTSFAEVSFFADS